MWLFMAGGGVGRILCNILHNHDVKISAFCVTDKTVNKKEQLGLPVYQFDELPFKKSETLILVGVNEPWNVDVVDILQKKDWQYIDVPAHAIDFSNLGAYNRPLLEITTNIGCPVQCKYCPQDVLCNAYYRENNQRISSMSLETFQACLDKVPKNTLIVFGGFSEPFLNEACFDMMCYANRNGFAMRLLTTLVGCTIEAFQKVTEVPFERVVLHVPDADHFAKIPLTDEYYEILDMALTAEKPNGQAFVDTANCQSRVHPQVLKYINGRVLVSSQLFDRAGNLKEDQRLQSVKGVQGKIYCSKSRNLNDSILLPDGSLVLCCMDFGLKHVLGNLLQQPYNEIMSGEMIQFVKRAMMNEAIEGLLCRNCTYAKSL